MLHFIYNPNAGNNNAAHKANILKKLYAVPNSKVWETTKALEATYFTKKAIEENERFKREGKKSIPAVSRPVQPDPIIPDVEDIKSKFMDRLASKLENMFDQAPTQ
jgi:hypothetical protein